jgi:hypothetical protein
MSVLADRLLAVHAALDAAALPHAFGGAIALAYCTEEPRGTRDIDVNVFVQPSAAARVLAALPAGVIVDAAAVTTATTDGQVRVWWDETPVDVFLDVHEFHTALALGVRRVPFAGAEIPVLDCASLAVLKAMYGRTKDWADLEAMHEAGALDATTLLGWTTRLLGGDHASTKRLATLLGT